MAACRDVPQRSILGLSHPLYIFDTFTTFPMLLERENASIFEGRGGKWSEQELDGKYGFCIYSRASHFAILSLVSFFHKMGQLKIKAMFREKKVIHRISYNVICLYEMQNFLMYINFTFCISVYIFALVFLPLFF